MLEILLSVSILALLTGLSTPMFQSYQNQTQLRVTSEQTLSVLNKARTFARVGKNNSSWGVFVGENDITFFKGENYTSRDADFDLFLETKGLVTQHGLNEIVFSEVGAIPSATGTITFQLPNRNHRSIRIYETGRNDFVDAFSHNLFVESSAASVGGSGNEFLQNITLENASSSSMTLTHMSVTWTKASRNLEEILINGGSVWTGTGSSGDIIDISDVALSADTSEISTSFDFDNCMLDSDFNVTFTLSDQSSKETGTIEIGESC